MPYINSSKQHRDYSAKYIWAVVILVLIGAILAAFIIIIRPQSDPLEVLGRIAAGLAPTIAATLAVLKSQETHLSVNSRLDQFMAEHAKTARAEGVIQGAEEERLRQQEPPTRI